MRVLFVNENIGGHATVHHHLRLALGAHPEIEADFLDVPTPSLLRRLAGARVPGLASLDLDLQPIRAQLAASAWVRRAIGGRLGRYDVLHVYTQNAALLSQSALRQVPSVISTDTTTTENAYRRPHRQPTRFTPITVSASKPFERRALGAANIVVANSTWARRNLVVEYQLAPDRVRSQPLGITPPPIGPGPAPGTASHRPTIVFVGHQLERKGGRQLLELHQRHLAHRADLVLITSEAVAPAPRVTVVNDLVPGDDRLWPLLRRGAIFAFPSHIDQAPNAVLEAMAAGLPVVAMDTAALPEMVDHGRTGLLTDGGDRDLLAALTALIDDPSRRWAMGTAGRAHFEARYDAARCTTNLVHILREVGEASGGRPDRSSTDNSPTAPGSPASRW
ncbi:MAG: glycosyltransferase family 4 protein [Actinomycetia bacterium]|nr:glycosyltransferase family 4 protein [Actinomycetes bacterium]MCP5030264.1 glycosyltransferase family 4 protein [Actinomycetes bacterium]